MEFSFQLYSARNYPPLDAVLGKLARLGYTQVEGFGGLYGDAEGLSRSMKANGLTMPTGHFGIDMLKNTDQAMRTAEVLGVQTLFCPAIGKEARSPEEGPWLELGETLARLGETFKARGFGFGWHNHDFEFVPTTSGRMPMDIILETAPDLQWEMDVAWVVRGQQDPLPWLDRYGQRITAVHVKDIAPHGEATDEDGWADVGHGIMQWNQLIHGIRSRSGARYFVMEHDNPSDVERFAKRSIETAKGWN